MSSNPAVLLQDKDWPSFPLGLPCTRAADSTWPQARPKLSLEQIWGPEKFLVAFFYPGERVREY